MASSPTVRFVAQPSDPRTTSRISYAFSAYASLHGMRCVRTGPADLTVGYGRVDEAAKIDTDIDIDVTLAATYRPRPASAPAPAPVWHDGMPCFHPLDGGRPDVLGEIFEWLGAPHELACTALDPVGRIPPEHSLAGTHGIDRTVPWVNRWAARLHTQVMAALPGAPASPPSPFGGRRTFVASHDLDHLSDRRMVNTRRIVKNAGIALVADRDPRTAAQILVEAAGHGLRREPALVGVPRLLAGEAERGVRTTYTVIAESTHRRDGGYRLTDDFVRRTLDRIAERGHEIAVHGSYRSLEQPGQLTREYRLLRGAGHEVSGGRQHWLRHRGSELFRAVEAAGGTWDSTAGHPDDIGFRHGAAFPFLPYDFDREAPHPVVEIPLVIMERALRSATVDPAAWPAVATDLLRAAGADGWGGVAVLWHDDAFTGTTFPARLAEAYWSVLDAGDNWVPAREVAAVSRERWAAAGAGATDVRAGTAAAF